MREWYALKMRNADEVKTLASFLRYIKVVYLYEGCTIEIFANDSELKRCNECVKNVFKR